MKIQFSSYTTITAFLVILQVSNIGYADNLKEIARDVSSSVLLLEIRNGQDEKIGTGTGFCVSKDGLIVTNFTRRDK